MFFPPERVAEGGEGGARQKQQLLWPHNQSSTSSPEDTFSNPTNDVRRPSEGKQPHKYPQTPAIHFYCIQAAVLYFLAPLSTTHTGHSKTKIHTIDRTVSPQLFFWNSHWKQITSALRFHPIALGEQCSLPFPRCPHPNKHLPLPAFFRP